MIRNQSHDHIRPMSSPSPDSPNISGELDDPGSPILIDPSQEIHLIDDEMMLPSPQTVQQMMIVMERQQLEQQQQQQPQEEEEEGEGDRNNGDGLVECTDKHDNRTYFCEWKNCQLKSFDNLPRFLSHLHAHCTEIEEALADEPELTFHCLWCECNEEFNGFQLEEFYLHLSYHGYHSKLMSIGVCELDKLVKRLGRPVQCRLDGSSRTLLPALPDSFVCGWKECLTSFRDAESFYRHVEQHPFKDISIPPLTKQVLKKTRFATCMWTECRSAFTSRSRLRDHLKSHTQEKSFACPNCGSLFFNRTKFFDHFYRQMYNEEGNPDKLETYLLHVSLPDDEQLTLTLVSKVPSNQAEIASSMEKRAKDIAVAAVKAVKAGDKSGGGGTKTTTSEKGESLIDDSNRNQEKEQQPFPALPHVCSHCNRRMATSSLLQEHLRSHKTNWKCNICGYKTNSDSSLTHHVSYRHSDLRPFPCQFCDSKFKSRSDLRKHIDIHSDDHPYKCPLCSFKCRCCHTLAKHRKREHEEVEVVYQCHVCNKNFTRGNNLSRHLTKSHKLTIPRGKARFTYKRNDDGIYRLTDSDN